MTSLTVSSLFCRIVERSPHQVAVQEILDGRVQATTYGQLHERAMACAAEFRRRGLRTGDRVVLLAENSSHFLAAFLGSAIAGTTVVPVNTHLTGKELAWIIGNCQSSLVVASVDLMDLAAKAASAGGAGTPDVVDIVEAACPRTDDEAVDAPWWSPPDPQDLLYLGYTSGTTGKPKGVSVTHANRAQAIYLQAAEFGLTSDDVHLVVSPLYHTAPLTFALLQLCLGGTVRVRPGFDAFGIAADFVGGQFSTCFVAPAALQRILGQIPERAEVPSVVRSIIIGGSPCPVTVKNEVLRRLPGRLWEFYGATEVGIVTTLRPSEQSFRPRSAGRLMPGSEVIVRDPTSKKQCATSEVGEVWTRTLTQADGYFGAESSKHGWAFLGDVGFLDEEGFLHLVDRSADIIISGGVNVYSREVEAVLESHPEVTDVAVFGIPDEHWGEAVAAAVSIAGDGPTVAQLLDFCAESLAPYKRPKVITVLKELPRGATGKVNKRALRSDLEHSGPTQGTPPPTDKGVFTS